MVCNIICEALAVYGYKVIEAIEGVDGLRLATVNDHIDLLLTDVIMRQMNEQELYQKVIQIQSDIKVLFMSGYTSEIIAKKGVVTANVHFLQKPFERVGLVRAVRRALEANAV